MMYPILGVQTGIRETVVEGAAVASSRTERGMHRFWKNHHCRGESAKY